VSRLRNRFTLRLRDQVEEETTAKVKVEVERKAGSAWWRLNA